MINLAEFIRGLITNLFVLLGFAAVCTVFRGWALLRRRTLAPWAVGLLYGVMSVVVMLAPVVTHSGLTVDCRGGVLGTAALLLGPPAALACLLPPFAYRLALGPPHLLLGAGSLLLPVLLGTLAHLRQRRRDRAWTPRQAVPCSLRVGLGTNLLLALSAFCGGGMSALDIGVAEALAALLVTPVSMALLSALVLSEQRHITAVERLAETERRMLGSQKMAAIGQLSYRVAHTVLNALTVIQNHAELTKTDPENPKRVADSMDEIIRTVDTVSNLTGELVAFAIPGALRLRRMRLGMCLVGVERLLDKTIGKEVELVIRQGDAEGGTVTIDPNRIEQLIVHLAINAAEAVAGRGQITISTYETSLSEEERGRLMVGLPACERRQGRFAVLAVRDNGCGMTAEVVDRIFEPFFTTKADRENAGLGLPTVYAIVQQHHGFIDVQTRPGHGSTFLVYLPVTG